MKYDMILSGVGGQGTLLAAKILASLAVQSGLDVKLSEIHGMAQRGGSVITHVRMGKNVHAPVISIGSADFVLAFEWLEALRATPYLKEDGVLIASNQKIMPITVITGSGDYPSYDNNALLIDALELAKKAGNARCANTVMLGALSCYLPFSEEAWAKSFKECIKPQFLEVNTRAYELGRQYMKETQNI